MPHYFKMQEVNLNKIGSLGMWDLFNPPKISVMKEGNEFSGIPILHFDWLGLIITP